MRLKRYFIGLSLFAGASPAFAGGGLPHFTNNYEVLLRSVGLEHHYVPVAGALLALCILFVVGTIFSKSVGKSLATDGDIAPAARFTLSGLVEIVMEFLYNLTKDQCGKQYRKYLTLLSSMFLFILICNLTGLIPGFPPPTENMSTNVAIGFVTFVVYNWAGIKEHGAGYAKHFLGPVAFIAPFFVVIELFSHMSRPLSLGLRLMGNIYGDHLLLGVFTGLTYVIFPALLMFFGLLVAVIQSFVFTLLSGIYISMAISHDH